ncbi:hypothetical protein DFQ27_001886 [Actinomortierella ambigua]|uniref:DBF4-type domain-containing protein n=1 Tax=Actinomortierella ambigua TaxID=1343610 RepID=A0A9P6QDI4_9FUNG|nr:hypothetical protein DFQ27_001886 [Actinomortierella ambigua]
MRRTAPPVLHPAHSILLARTNAPNTAPLARHSQMNGQGQENIVPSAQPALFKHHHQHHGVAQPRAEPLDLLKGHGTAAPNKAFNTVLPVQKNVLNAPAPRLAKAPLTDVSAVSTPATLSTKTVLPTVEKRHDARQTSITPKARTSSSKPKAQSQEWIAHMRASLKTSRFFFDSVDNTTVNKLTRAITSAGAVVAMFLSLSDVTHIITTKQVPTPEEVQRFKQQQEQQQQHQQQQQQQHHGIAPTQPPIGLPQVPQNALLLKALTRNITVWSLTDAFQILGAVTGETSAAQNEPSLRELLLRDRTFGPTTAQNDDYHVLRGAYLLVEDATGTYSTIIAHEFEPQSKKHPWIRLHYQNTSGSPYVWIEEKSKSRHLAGQQHEAAPDGEAANPVVAPATSTAVAPEAAGKETTPQEVQHRTLEPAFRNPSPKQPLAAARKAVQESAPASGIINSMTSHSVSTQSVVGRLTNPLGPAQNLLDPRLEQLGKRVLTTAPVGRALPPVQQAEIAQSTEVAAPCPNKPAIDTATAAPAATQPTQPVRRSTRQATNAALVGAAVSKQPRTGPEGKQGLEAQVPPTQQDATACAPNACNPAAADAALAEPAENKAQEPNHDSGIQKSSRRQKDSSVKRREQVQLPPPTDIGIDEKDLPKAKSGYCENCRTQYTNLREHAATSRHRRYAYDTAKFQALDRLLAELPRRRREPRPPRSEGSDPTLNNQPLQVTSTDASAVEKAGSDNTVETAQADAVDKIEGASSTSITLVDKDSNTTVTSSMATSQETRVELQVNEQDTTATPANKTEADPAPSEKDVDSGETKLRKSLADKHADDDEATTEPLPQTSEEQEDTNAEVTPDASIIAAPEPSVASPVADDPDEHQEQEQVSQEENAAQATDIEHLDEIRGSEGTPSVSHVRARMSRFFEQEPQSGSLASRLETDATVPDEKFLDSAANVPQSVSTDLPGPASATPVRLVIGASSALGPSEAESGSNMGVKIMSSSFVTAGAAKNFDDGPSSPVSPDGGIIADYSDDGYRDCDESVAMVKSPSAGRGVFSRLGGLPSRPRNQPQLLPPSIPASGFISSTTRFSSSTTRFSSSTSLRTPLKSSAASYGEAHQQESYSSTPQKTAATPTTLPPSGAFHGPLKRKLENIMADERANENELRFQSMNRPEPPSPSAASTRGTGVASSRWTAPKPSVDRSPLSRRSTTTLSNHMHDNRRTALGSAPSPVPNRLTEFLARNKDVVIGRDAHESKENQDPAAAGWRSMPPVVKPAALKQASRTTEHQQQQQQQQQRQQQHHHQQKQQYEQEQASLPTTPVKQTGRYYGLDDNMEPPPAPKLPSLGFWPSVYQQGHPESYLSHHYGPDGRLVPTSPATPASPSVYPPSEGVGRYSEYDSRMLSSPITGSPSQRASKRLRQAFPVMSHAEQQEDRCFQHYQGDRLPEPAGQKMVRTNSSSFVEEFSEYGEGCMVFIE